MLYKLNVNGLTRDVNSNDPEQPLLYVLRNNLDLTGAKFGCGLGQCGACSVLIDDEATRSCQITVAQAVGKKIVTLEGIGSLDKPHAVQSAFIKEQAAQCGYCANGMVVSVVALLKKHTKPSLDDIKQALSANLCRCGTHDRILRAAMRASGQVMP